MRVRELYFILPTVNCCQFHKYLTHKSAGLHNPNLTNLIISRDFLIKLIVPLLSLQDRLDRFSYYGIPAYNNALIDSYNYSGAMTVPRPQVSSSRGGGGPGPVNVSGGVHESTTDPVELREYRDHERDILHRNPVPSRDKSGRAQDSFQRDLARTLDQYRDDNVRPHHPGYGHIWLTLEEEVWKPEHCPFSDLW